MPSMAGLARYVFTPGKTNCACTILLNLSTTLPRLHSLMSFRSGGPGQEHNEVGDAPVLEGRYSSQVDGKWGEFELQGLMVMLPMPYLL